MALRPSIAILLVLALTSCFKAKVSSSAGTSKGSPESNNPFKNLDQNRKVDLTIEGVVYLPGGSALTLSSLASGAAVESYIVAKSDFNLNGAKSFASMTRADNSANFLSIHQKVSVKDIILLVASLAGKTIGTAIVPVAELASLSPGSDTLREKVSINQRSGVLTEILFRKDIVIEDLTSAILGNIRDLITSKTSASDKSLTVTQLTDKLLADANFKKTLDLILGKSPNDRSSSAQNNYGYNNGSQLPADSMFGTFKKITGLENLTLSQNTDGAYVLKYSETSGRLTIGGSTSGFTVTDVKVSVNPAKTTGCSAASPYTVGCEVSKSLTSSAYQVIYDLTTASAGTTYTFTVTTLNGSATVASSATYSFTYQDDSGGTATDSVAPTAGTFSGNTGVGDSTVTLNWSAAADNATAQAALLFLVCSSTVSAAAIDTVSECEGATQEMAYAVNTLTYNVTGKTPGTTYYFNVVVKDAAGNKSIYNGTSQATNADSTAPTAGAFSASTGVGAVAFTLAWTAGSDTGTSAASLQYLACSGANAAAIDTVAECDGGATTEMAYTANTLTKAITGKSPSTTYYYNVVVKDAAGNRSIYPGKTQATTADTTGPTAGTFSASGSVTATSFTLNWSAAVDDVTAAASLQYYVCSGANAAAIDTVTECEGATQEMNWTANTVTLAISSKTPSTTYYYNVVVRDAAGNKSPYDGKSQATTADSAAPTAGTFSASTSVSSSGFTLNWSAASDNVTTASALEYFGCSGAAPVDIDTVAECEGATQEMNWTANTLTKAISGKTASTTYYYNVVVKDAAGNKAIYNGKTQATNAAGPQWTQEAYIKAGNSGAGDSFGNVVSISEDTIVVGAYAEDSNQTTITNGTGTSSDNSVSDSGAIYIYKRAGNAWSPEAYILNQKFHFRKNAA